MHPIGARRSGCDYTMQLADILAGWLPAGSRRQHQHRARARSNRGSDRRGRRAGHGATISPPPSPTSRRCATTPAARSTSASSRSRTAFSRRPRRRSPFSKTRSSPPASTRSRASGCYRSDRPRTLMRRHLGVCFDTCHVALQFEDLGGIAARLSAPRASAFPRCSSAPRSARPSNAESLGGAAAFRRARLSRIR